MRETRICTKERRMNEDSTQSIEMRLILTKFVKGGSRERRGREGGLSPKVYNMKRVMSHERTTNRPSSHVKPMRARLGYGTAHIILAI